MSINSLAGGYFTSYPAGLRAGAGYRVEKQGLSARIVADFSGVPLLTDVPAAGHILVQDEKTKEFNRLDLLRLPTTVPQDGSVSNSKFAAAPAFTLKGNATSAMAQPQDIALSTLTQPGNPVGDAFAGKASLGHKAVADADYFCSAKDVQVGFTALTASRTVSLPDVDSFPFGQDLVIADETGACSDTLLIRVRAGAGTGDALGGAETDPVLGVPAIVLSSPFQAVRFRRGAANLWIRM